MKTITIVLLSAFSGKIILAGGAGTSSQDNYFYLIPLVILIILWAFPGVYSFLKSKLVKFLKYRKHDEPMSPE